MIKFKLMKNTFSVYLDIFNNGLLLISDQFLLSCPIKINFKPSDRIKKNTENGYLHQSGSCHGIVVLSFHLKSRHHKFSHYTINLYMYVGKPHRIP